MATLNEYPFIEGSVGLVYDFYLKDEEGQDFDLTGATVTMEVQGQSSRSCTVVSATGGQARYTTGSTENTGDDKWIQTGGPGKDGRFPFRIKAVNGSTYTLFTVPYAYVVATRA